MSLNPHRKASIVDHCERLKEPEGSYVGDPCEAGSVGVIGRQAKGFIGTAIRSRRSVGDFGHSIARISDRASGSSDARRTSS